MTLRCAAKRSCFPANISVQRLRRRFTMLLIDPSFHPSHLSTHSNEACQLSRLLSRPQLNPSDPPLTTTAARARISAQLPLVSKLPYADTVIDNSGSPVDLEVQIEALIRRWRSSTKGWGLIEWICPPVGIWIGFWTLVWRNIKATRRRGRRGDQGKERRRGRGENDRLKRDENIELKVM